MAKSTELSPEEKLLRVIQGTAEPETQDEAPTRESAGESAKAKVGAVKAVPAGAKEADSGKPAAPAAAPESSKSGGKPALKPAAGSGLAPKGSESPKVVSAPVPAAPKEAKPAAPSPAATAAVNESAKATPASAKAEVSGRDGGKSSPVSIASFAAPIAKHAPVRRSAFKAVNRSLLAVAALMLVLFGVEFWNSVLAVERSVQGRTTAVMEADVLRTGGELQPVEEYLARLTGFRIWHPDDVNNPRPMPPRLDSTPSGPVIPWQTYCVSNMNFIGMSGTNEAIIVDRKIERMYLVKVGQELRAGDHRIKLSAMGTDVVVVTDLDGRSKITLK